MLYIGRKKNDGPWYVASDDYEREFPGIQGRSEFYAMLRAECGMPESTPDFQVWAEVSGSFTITPDGFIRD